MGEDVEMAVKGKEEEEHGAAYFSYKDITSNYYQVLLEKKRPPCCRVLWYIITVGLIGFASFMVYKLLYSYFQYSSYNKTKIIWTNNVTLPAISICSANLLNYTKLNESNLADSDLALLRELMTEIEEKTGNPNYEIESMDRYSALDNIVLPDIGLIDINRQFKMEPEFFPVFNYYDFKFARKEVVISEEEYRVFIMAHELGWCLHLNDNEHLVQTIAGSNGGLTIDLDAKMKDYLYSTSSAGFKIFIRNANETVLLQDSGYILPPGNEVFMKLSKKKVKRLKKPYGECVDTPSDFVSRGNIRNMRTARECNEETKFYLMAEHCNCLPWYLLETIAQLLYNDSPTAKETYRLLSEKWAKALNVTSKDESKVDLDYLQCSFAEQLICNTVVQDKMAANEMTFCEESCSFNAYDVEITSSLFPPTETYFDTFIFEKIDYKPTYDYARQNFLRLHIFYGDLTEQAVTQEKAYEIQNFIAEFGGTMDLIIGISFFTLFQLLEISVAVVIMKCCRRRKAN